MVVVRRILIGIVGLLLLLDAVALGVVKFAAGPAPSDEKSKVVIWIDNKAEAEQATELLRSMNYEPLLKAAQRPDFVEANYRLVMTASRRELLDPVAKVLRKEGHKNLSFNDDGTALYYGGFYTEKSQASRTAKALMAKEKFLFEVEPGQKKVMKDSFRVILLEVPSNMVSQVTAKVSAEVDVAEVEEEPLEPVADTADDVEEE